VQAEQLAQRHPGSTLVLPLLPLLLLLLLLLGLPAVGPGRSVAMHDVQQQLLAGPLQQLLGLQAAWPAY
jgi:hypothetical protein